eukprot:1845219-Rhodomonas_salina.2
MGNGHRPLHCDVWKNEGQWKKLSNGKLIGFPSNPTTQVLIVTVPLVLLCGCCVMCVFWMRLWQRASKDPAKDEEEGPVWVRGKSERRSTVLTMSSTMSDEGKNQETSPQAMSSVDTTVAASNPFRIPNGFGVATSVAGSDDEDGRSVTLSVKSSLKYTVPKHSESRSTKYSQMMATPFDVIAQQDLGVDGGRLEDAAAASRQEPGAMNQVELQATKRPSMTGSAASGEDDAENTQDMDVEVSPMRNSAQVTADPNLSVAASHQAAPAPPAVQEIDSSLMVKPRRPGPGDGGRGSGRRKKAGSRERRNQGGGSPIAAEVMSEEEMVDGHTYVVNRRGSAVFVI